jgi:hypothetical protein
MAIARVHFTHLIVDSLQYGSDDDHMVSRAFFDLDIGGTLHQGLHCDIKQVVGSSFESEPPEVSPPIGFMGPFNFEAFRGAVAEYYTTLVGSQGSALRLGGSNNRIHDGRIGVSRDVEFSVDGRGAGW